jgi:hypothetical protein
MIVIIFGILFLLLLIYWIYFKIKSPFWSRQPVNHPHHFYRKAFNPFVIKEEFYISKYINPLQITTQKWSEVNQEVLEDFIQKHFYNTKQYHYRPISKIHIEPYYLEDKNAFVSHYYVSNILVGVISNRTLVVHLKTPKIQTQFSVSYIDFLCVHEGHRRRNVAPELIQTHEHFQRTRSPQKCLISLFKKEGALHPFTPLVQYNTLVCGLDKQIYIQHTPLSTHLKTVWFSLSTIKKIVPHLYEMKNSKQAFITPSLTSIMKLVERKSIRIYGVIDSNTQEVVASYWFRDTGFYAPTVEGINNDNKNKHSKPNVECFASLYASKKKGGLSQRDFTGGLSQRDFTGGFLSALIDLNKEFHLLQLESIGDNSIIAQLPWITEYKIPCAYYLYNYSYKTLPAANISILI